MGSITLNKPSGGQLTLSPEDGATNETVTIPSVGVGKILNVWHTSSSNAYVFSAVTTFTDIDLELTVTPSSSSSKFLLMTDIGVLANSGGRPSARFTRDGVSLLEQGYVGYIATGDYDIGYHAFKYLDSPNTTSSITYKVQGKSDASGVITFSYNDAFGDMTSGLTIMEVAQ